MLDPPDCVADACELAATWVRDGRYVKFELQGKTEGWLSIGFSYDQQMVSMGLEIPAKHRLYIIIFSVAH